MSHSSSLKGVGIIAGGIYFCADGKVEFEEYFEKCCTKPNKLDIIDKKLYAKQLEKQGFIDNITNLKDKPVYLFHGLLDQVVNSNSTRLNNEFFLAYGSNVKLTLLPKAYHAWVTDDYGRGCKTNGLPWVINCDFNLAFDMMTHFYKDLKNGTTYDPN